MQRSPATVTNAQAADASESFRALSQDEHEHSGAGTQPEADFLVSSSPVLPGQPLPVAGAPSAADSGSSRPTSRYGQTPSRILSDPDCAPDRAFRAEAVSLSVDETSGLLDSDREMNAGRSMSAHRADGGGMRPHGTNRDVKLDGINTVAPMSKATMNNKSASTAGSRGLLRAALRKSDEDVGVPRGQRLLGSSKICVAGDSLRGSVVMVPEPVEDAKETKAKLSFWAIILDYALWFFDLKPRPDQAMALTYLHSWRLLLNDEALESMFQERLYIQTRALFALLIFLSAVANVAFLTLDFGSYDVLKSGNALGVFGKMEGATTFFLYTIFPARVVSVALSICMLVVESKKEKGVYRYKPWKMRFRLAGAICIFLLAASVVDNVYNLFYDAPVFPVTTTPIYSFAAFTIVYISSAPLYPAMIASIITIVIFFLANIPIMLALGPAQSGVLGTVVSYAIVFSMGLLTAFARERRKRIRFVELFILAAQQREKDEASTDQDLHRVDQDGEVHTIEIPSKGFCAMASFLKRSPLPTPSNLLSRQRGGNSIRSSRVAPMESSRGLSHPVNGKPLMAHLMDRGAGATLSKSSVDVRVRMGSVSSLSPGKLITSSYSSMVAGRRMIVNETESVHDSQGGSMSNLTFRERFARRVREIVIYKLFCMYEDREAERAFLVANIGSAFDTGQIGCLTIFLSNSAFTVSTFISFSVLQLPEARTGLYVTIATQIVLPVVMFGTFRMFSPGVRSNKINHLRNALRKHTMLSAFIVLFVLISTMAQYWLHTYYQPYFGEQATALFAFRSVEFIIFSLAYLETGYLTTVLASVLSGLGILGMSFAFNTLNSSIVLYTSIGVIVTIASSRELEFENRAYFEGR